MFPVQAEDLAVNTCVDLLLCCGWERGNKAA